MKKADLPRYTAGRRAGNRGGSSLLCCTKNPFAAGRAAGNARRYSRSAPQSLQGRIPGVQNARERIGSKVGATRRRDTQGSKFKRPAFSWRETTPASMAGER